MPGDVAWFVDGSYLSKVWWGLHGQENLDYLKLRRYLEGFVDLDAGEKLSEAYYFNADPDPPSAKQNAFHNALAYPPPTGPGLRVKLYWLQKESLYWPKTLGGGPVVHPTSGQAFERQFQKAVDVGLAFHLMRSFARKRWEKLFLATGDADFHEVVQYLVETENVSLFLIGSMQSISEDLRPYATTVIEMSTIAPQVGRPRTVSEPVAPPPVTEFPD